MYITCTECNFATNSPKQAAAHELFNEGHTTVGEED